MGREGFGGWIWLPFLYLESFILTKATKTMCNQSFLCLIVFNWMNSVTKLDGKQNALIQFTIVYHWILEESSFWTWCHGWLGILWDPGCVQVCCRILWDQCYCFVVGIWGVALKCRGWRKCLFVLAVCFVNNNQTSLESGLGFWEVNAMVGRGMRVFVTLSICVFQRRNIKVHFSCIVATTSCTMLWIFSNG